MWWKRFLRKKEEVKPVVVEYLWRNKETGKWLGWEQCDSGQFRDCDSPFSSNVVVMSREQVQSLPAKQLNRLVEKYSLLERER